MAITPGLSADHSRRIAHQLRYELLDDVFTRRGPGVPQKRTSRIADPAALMQPNPHTHTQGFFTNDPAHFSRLVVGRSPGEAGTLRMSLKPIGPGVTGSDSASSCGNCST